MSKKTGNSKKKQWVPRVIGGDRYFISHDETLYVQPISEEDITKEDIKQGNYFLTKDLANAALKKIIEVLKSSNHGEV